MVRLNGGIVTPQDFRTIVDKARASGRNADFVQEVVKDEMRELVETAPPEELDLLQNAFLGERCQRRFVWEAIQELAAAESA